MRKILSLFAFIVLSQVVKAQQGFGTSNPAPSAVIDMVAGTKGVLMPRVALTATDVAGPVTSPATYLTVFNTATAGTAPTNVTPGYYYWDGTKWVRLATLTDEPWYNQTTKAGANANTQNIYQNANVGIGDFTTTNSLAKLDVRGAVRVGKPNAAELDGTSLIGTNSFAGGTNSSASALNSFAFGGNAKATGIGAIALGGQSDLYGSIAEGDYSLALGHSNVSSGPSAVSLGRSNRATAQDAIAIGYGNKANNSQSIAIGNSTTSTGLNAVALGVLTTASSYAETVLGRRNAILTGTSDSWVGTDPLLQVGNSGTATTNSNALTILKNGNTGIGEIAPTSTLQVAGSVSMAIRTITSASPTSDFVLTANDYTIVVENADPITLSLPDPANCKGRIYVVHFLNSYSIMFDKAIIGGVGSTPAGDPYVNSPSLVLQSDGTRWIYMRG